MRWLIILLLSGSAAMAEEGNSKPWNGTVTLAPQQLSKSYIWEPKPDITAYELALAIPLMFSKSWDAWKSVENLPLEVRRHFREERR
jgi:hypothetical protein